MAPLNRVLLSASMSLLLLSGCGTVPGANALGSNPHGNSWGPILNRAQTSLPSAATTDPTVLEPAPLLPASSSTAIGTQQVESLSGFFPIAALTGPHHGSLLVYDFTTDQTIDLSPRIADLGVGSQHDVERLNPQIVGTDTGSAVVIGFKGSIYGLPMETQNRFVLASDANTAVKARVTRDGHVLLYVNNQGYAVTKVIPPDPAVNQPEILTEVQRYQEAISGDNGIGRIEDLDISGDGKWIVLVIEGSLLLYDVTFPHLFHLLPLGNQNFAGLAGTVKQAAISGDGRFILFTGGSRHFVWVLDRATGSLDTLPALNAHLKNAATEALDLEFHPDSGTVDFEIQTSTERQIFSYDLLSRLLLKIFATNTTPCDPY